MKKVWSAKSSKGRTPHWVLKQSGCENKAGIIAKFGATVKFSLKA